MFISARSVENCISVERLNTLNTDLQSLLKDIKNLQPAKKGLFSLTSEAAVHINFAVNLARSFRTPILHCIDNHIQNRCSKKYRKIHGKQLCWNHLLIKLQASGLQFYQKDTSAQVFSCEFWKISKKTLFTEHLSFGQQLK